MYQQKLTQFLSSASTKRSEPGPSTANSDSEGSDTSEANVSAKKRSRSFSSKWLKTFSWLEFHDCQMFCDPCQRTKKSNPFTEGCTNFRLSTLERHEKSKSHTEALKQVQWQLHFARSVQNADTVQRQRSDEDAQTKRHIVQLRTVYMMATNGISSNNFVDLMALQNENGCEFADSYYRKPEVVTEMETVLYEQILSSLLEDIERRPFFGLMLDETCDITVEKKLVVYIRYIKDAKPVVSYLGNQRIQDCTAEGIKVALCDFLTDRNIISNDDFSKMIALGTDGASVMVGCRNGLGVKLKELNKCLVQVHCIAHRLNLAASQASKGLDYFEDYKRYIHQLYRFYSDSSVRYDKLRELQELLHGTVQQVPEGTSVRWLSVESAVKMVFKYIDAIILSLEDDKDKTGKACGLWNFFSTTLFLLITALMIDVLTVIGILSLTFQRDSVNLASIRHNVSSMVETLQNMKTGSHTVDQVLQELGEVGKGPAVYKGVQLTDNNPIRARFTRLRELYINQLAENLGNRFPKNDLDLLECLDVIFNPKRYPEAHSELAAYGNGQLERLCQFFGHLVDCDRMKGQFLPFKHLAVSYRRLNSFELHVTMLINEYTDVYPDFTKLASIAIVIPVSSAPCERGFSHQNALKTKVRNRINPDRLNRLLMIRLVGPPRSEMDFSAAARAFGGLKNRKK